MKMTGKVALFIGGTLFGSAGLKLLGSRDARKVYLKLLGSRDARKVYSHVTAAALRCKDQVMRDVESVQEGCSDILADAKAINKDKTAEAEAAYIEDGVKV